MIRLANEIVQAFPVTERTYVGTPNGYSSGGSILHAVNDCQITFDFGTRGTVVMDVSAGQDLALDEDIQSITATDVCWIS
jgi:hypothetical protein